MTTIAELSTNLRTATLAIAEAAMRNDDVAAEHATDTQVDHIRALAQQKPSTPDEVADMCQTTLVVLASDGGLADCMDCTHDLVRAALEAAARLKSMAA